MDCVPRAGHAHRPGPAPGSTAAPASEVPPRVEYTLTDLGKSLIKPISVIAEWAEVNVGRITAAQEAYDEAAQR
jgi:DNA-binding HxlR family transcriptional regulator